MNIQFQEFILILFIKQGILHLHLLGASTLLLLWVPLLFCSIYLTDLKKSHVMQVFDLKDVKPSEFVQYGLACLENMAGLGDQCAKETREKLRIMVLNLSFLIEDCFFFFNLLACFSTFLLVRTVKHQLMKVNIKKKEVLL